MEQLISYNHPVELGNRLCIEFLGFRFVNDDPEGMPDGYFYNDDHGSEELKYLTFHEDWNSLMAVYTEINKLDTFLHTHEYRCIGDHLKAGDLVGTYNRIVDFLLFYKRLFGERYKMCKDQPAQIDCRQIDHI